jgi:5-formyltetrahydrofolate cyclo-ligase
MRGVRKTAPLEACAARSEKIIVSLEAHDAMKSPKGVALFWPILERHEVDLRALDSSLRARGVRVAYPSLDPDTGNMTFRFVDDVATLEDAGYGFAEPPRDAAIAAASELDVVVVPAIAVDPTGHRIGYGAGYYDRTLPAFVPPAVAIAVIYDWQLIAEVPATPGDVRVDWIITDLRVLDAHDATPP